MKEETILKSSHSIKQRTLPVLNMSCASCAASVGSILSSQPGVISAEVNYADSSTTVSYDPSLIEPKALQDAVRSIGYDLVLEEGLAGDRLLEEKKAHSFQALKQNTLWAFALTIPLVIVSMGLPDLPYAAYIMWLLSTPVLLLFGRQFFKGAYLQTKMGKANMDTLVAMSTGTAYLYSLIVTLLDSYLPDNNTTHHVYFESAAVIICFILLGKFLEEKARNQTSADIKKLIGLQPQTATLLIHDKQQIIQVTAIKVQDRLLVKPGEAVAVDGLLKSGQPFIDESMISGEPIPVQKLPGDVVFAGTINQSSAFEMEAEKVGSDTVLAGIIALVKEAQGSKAPIQRLVDKIAAKFVVFVVAVAILSFGTWWLLGGEHGFTQGLISFVTVLVIACPCALGLATPAAIMVGIGKAARQGILIKDAESLQIAAKLTDVVLDKTGTLTAGKPKISQMVWLDPVHGNDPLLSAILAEMERQSQHPLAPAIVRYLDQSSAMSADQKEPLALDHTELLPGEGIQATFKGKPFYAGNTRLLKNKGILVPETVSSASVLADFLSRHATETVIYFTDEKTILACIALTDPLSSVALPAISSLKHQKIKIHMLTGDNEQSAKKIATQAGITQYQAGMLPEDKLTYIRQLKQRGAKVAMIGDGINDSAALAEADISMAMSHGSAIAIDVAKITLMGGDLRKISAAIRISKQTNRTIKENLFWAFVYNLMGIPIAAGLLYPFNGFMLSPMIAGAAMALSSVSVLANSLRLKLKRIG